MVEAAWPLRFFHRGGHENPGKLAEHYLLEAELGKGSYGTAHRATCRRTGAARAVKLINAKKLKDPERFEKEADIARQLDHPNLVRLYEIFRDATGFALVMELCTGGELFDRIRTDGREGFDELAASGFTQQIFAAVAYLHSHHFAHRDVKPENFLFEGGSVKLIDFGLACRFEPGRPMTTVAGTPLYVAPEVLSGRYSERCDVWSAGVIVYVLLCGYPPFRGRDDRQVLRRVKRGEASFPLDDWYFVSKDAKWMTSQLLTCDASRRPSATTGLDWSNAWNAKRRRVAGQAPRSPVDVAGSLQAFREHSSLKRMVLTAVAQQQRGELLGDALPELFRHLDRNGDGELSTEEMMEVLGTSSSPDSEAAEQLMCKLDSDGSGRLDYTEFVAATMDKNIYAQRDVLHAVFRGLDLNGDGRISCEELAHAMTRSGATSSAPSWRIEAVLREADEDGDGALDFEEFVRAVAGQQIESAAEPAADAPAIAGWPAGDSRGDNQPVVCGAVQEAEADAPPTAKQQHEKTLYWSFSTVGNGSTCSSSADSL